MDADNEFPDKTWADPPIFSAVLNPHRSLPSAGFVALMLGLGGVSFAAGVLFLVIGAWPVLGFFGLDVALVYWAFRLNYRRAAAYEQVMVTPSKLLVRKVSHRGRVQEWTLNPRWTRLDRQVHEAYGLERLYLVSRGMRLGIAGFLSPDERESFASALAAAIGEARRGPIRALPQ